MNDMNQPGPCADYEHGIAELIDGSLGPEKARAIRGHLDACPRCRAWHAAFAAVDAGLAGALPRPALSPDFADRLRERLASTSRTVERGDLASAADVEYRRLVDSLGRGAWHGPLLHAIGGAGVAACAVLLARSLLPHAGTLLPALEGAERITALGGLGAAVALVALAWSASRGVLPAFRLRA